jgi:hypothetical protein
LGKNKRFFRVLSRESGFLIIREKTEMAAEKKVPVKYRREYRIFDALND